MADYKEFLSGAFDRISGGVKNYTNGRSFREICEDGAERAGNIGKAAKTLLAMNSESEELKKVYCEIGKLYFEEQNGIGDEFFGPLFERVNELTVSIEEKRQELEMMKDAAAAAISSFGKNDGQRADGDASFGATDANIVDFNEIVDESGKN